MAMRRPAEGASSCGTVIEPFVRALADRTDLPPVQVIGGNGSAALLHVDTVIDLVARTIEAPADCDLPRFRPDHSLRDIDALVLSTDHGKVDAVEALAEELIGRQLKISIFGLKTIADLERQRHQPMRSSAKIVLGDRYVTETDAGPPNARTLEGFKALYPFQVPMSADTFETFHLATAELSPIPTAHPGATILNYLTRSISSVRAKDTSKIETMTENVLTRYPEVREWILDGPGRDMLELARILHTLREPRRDPRVLRIGSRLQLVPYTLAELNEHEGFMAGDLNVRRQRAVIEMAHLKSHLLGRLEANSTLASFWQKHLEDRLKERLNNDR